MELDIPVGVLSIGIVVYRITYIMIPMMKEAIRDKNVHTFFKALTQIV